ncbi:Signal transduction histidine kinase [Lachnospiraceae bacterium NE2001]|nr:Signal transduction histidine kinase [Lachnospiraceae bacterium NE2001]
MKKLAKLYITAVLLFALLFVISNALITSIQKKKTNTTNILLNRIVEDLQQKYAEKLTAGGSDNSLSESEIQTIVNTYMKENRAALSAEFGKVAFPNKVIYISTKAGEGSVALINKDDSSDKVWAFKSEGNIIGFVVFEYSDRSYRELQLILNISLLAAFFIAIGICIYISQAVLRPFDKLSTYPEKLSKNEITEKLPETKNRMFGRFIWGINMLSDNMQNKQKRVDELSRDHMTMLTTIAHGIKTPVANIKLYADAISTGLYQPDGKINESDAEVAKKISKNADDVTELVTELIEQASGTVVNYTPEIDSFYLEELKTFLDEEYSNRLKMLSIPYTFELGHNAIVKSDKSGICRILSQLMDNAIKYGDGGGIYVSLNKEDDGYYFVVKNKGEVLGEKELPYIFNSFWRGSNAEKTGGSGIGLFESREIAQSLYGDIYVKADKDAGEMEFDIYIPAFPDQISND